MKRTLLACLLSAFSFCAVYAQGSLELRDKGGANISGTSFDIWGDTSSTNTMSYLFDAYNASSSTKTFYMERQVISEVPGSQNYFCWDVCYPPFVTTSPNGVVIVNAALYTLGTVDYQPLGNWGTTTIRYVFWDYNNTNDSSWFTVRWNAGILGMQEELSGSLLPAFPNPSSENTTIKYQLNGSSNGQIRIFNMLGDLVKEVSLQNQKGSFVLNTSEMESGIYFYSLVAGERTLATRKLIVSR